MNPSNRKVTVIGAGVIGMATAVHLQRDGHDVTVIDRDAPGQGCSFGNAGILAPSYCVPMSSPGTAWHVPGWLLDPLGPLSIRWRDFPSLIPWFLRFLRAGTASRAEASSKILRDLHINCLTDFQDLFASIGAADLIKPSGCLYAYESQKSLAAHAADWDLSKRRGVRLEMLDGNALHEMEPGLAPSYVAGVFLPDDGQVTSPLAIVEALADHFCNNGGTILRANIQDMDVGTDGPRCLNTDTGSHDLDIVVIAAGAFSGSFAKRLGSPVPLVGERGYHITLPEPGVTVRTPVMHGEGKYVLTPMEMGLRIAGTAEFAALDAPTKYDRARVLLKHVRRMLPGVNTDGYSEWMGHRPTLPDGLPVIAQSPNFPTTFFAFGHSHAGLMGSVITGRTIADLVAMRTPALDVAPFRVNRF
ncbi:MAG: FAD-dependent oxidoreductase [Rhodospirillaceae bacterium]|nr:FAD-dependent oxidoreductase [Rhodospirillaceae bacterium]